MVEKNGLRLRPGLRRPGLKAKSELTWVGLVKFGIVCYDRNPFRRNYYEKTVAL
jgi:hypothetical protein